MHTTIYKIYKQQGPTVKKKSEKWNQIDLKNKQEKNVEGGFPFSWK